MADPTSIPSPPPRSIAPRKETPHSTVATIITGDFRERRGYAVWRSRGTSDWLLICTYGGLGRITCDGGQINPRPGDIVLIRPDTPHDYGVERSLNRWDFFWAHFHPRNEWLDYLAWPQVAPGILRIAAVDPAAGRSILNAARQMHEFAIGARRRREAFAMNALEELLLLCDAQNPLAATALLDPRIRSAMDHACRHLSRKLTPDLLADIAGLSGSRFAHLFRQQVGAAPRDFIERQRLARAGQLLEVTSRSIKDISREVGFDNPFYFTLRFKKQTGLSPREFRRKSIRPVPRTR